MLMDAHTNLPSTNDFRQLSEYTTELELEVNRLRRKEHQILLAVQKHVRTIQELCHDTRWPVDAALPHSRIGESCTNLNRLLDEFTDFPVATHDEVVRIDIRPFVQQIFAWQQRLSGADRAVLHFDLVIEEINWFPIRLRHILDNLISNSLRFRDDEKGEIRVALSITTTASAHEIRVSDNGLGIPHEDVEHILEATHRCAPTRKTGLGVGLAVVKYLVEQCCGSVTVVSRQGQGASVLVVLPRFDIDDHVDPRKL